MFQQQHEGAPWLNMFSAQDATWHKNFKMPVANKFTMSSIVTLEPMADECMDILMTKLNDRVGQPIDLGDWLQWSVFQFISKRN
jgi:cytochrome P450